MPCEDREFTREFTFGFGQVRVDAPELHKPHVAESGAVLGCWPALLGHPPPLSLVTSSVVEAFVLPNSELRVRPRPNRTLFVLVSSSYQDGQSLYLDAFLVNGKIQALPFKIGAYPS